jgi:hypothetical protein
LDLDGFSSGIITWFHKNLTFVNYFVVCLGPCIVVHNKSLCYSLTFLNVYVPYEGRKWFSDILFSLSCFQVDNLIIGGDLNLTLNKDKIWGTNALEDNLTHYFVEKFELASWV